MPSRDDRFESIRHWSLYGQRGSPSTNRVTATDSTNIRPFTKPETATWDAHLLASEVPTLLSGFRPRQMEDKWVVYADGPDAQGIAVVHMHRSWTGKKSIELTVAVPLGNDGILGQEDARVTDISWETHYENNYEQDEETAKEWATEVCNWVLSVNLRTSS